MSDDPLDRDVHDFLDGRLSATERARFEARMRDDPALAAHVERYRAIGETLRGETPELSPGFYTRARARFEAARPAPRRLRLGSWEAVGLATAAVIALAIFLPPLLERESPIDEALAPRGVGEGQAAPTAAPQDAAGKADDSSLRQAEPPPAVAQAPDAGAAARPGAGEAEDDAISKKAVEDSFAPAPSAPPPVPRSEPSPARAQSTEEVAVAAAPELAAGGIAANEGYLSARAEPFTALALDHDQVEAGAVVVVDAVEETAGREAVDKEEFAGTETKQERRERQKRSNVSVRWLLIGPREAPFSCSGMRFTTEGDAWVIALSPPATDRPAAPFGCAVALPRDEREVRVTGP